jgi:His/Glu/Gln/Arg/opine family amino acid ABC transporter permease subunit
LFLQSAGTTILLSVCIIIIGVVLGLIFCLMRLSNFRPFKFLKKLDHSRYFRWLAKAGDANPVRFISVLYIEVIRNTPSLLQLLIVYAIIPYGIPNLEFFAAVIALSINSSAYVAEIVRSGIQAVDIGQMEAARSLGMKYGLAMYKVIIPQAVKNILPALGNEFITIIKESSLAYVLGNVYELTFVTKIVQSTTFRGLEPLLVSGVMYFVICFILSKFMGSAERRMRRSERK